MKSPGEGLRAQATRPTLSLVACGVSCRARDESPYSPSCEMRPTSLDPPLPADRRDSAQTQGMPELFDYDQCTPRRTPLNLLRPPRR